jgi:hypothetical protein
MATPACLIIVKRYHHDLYEKLRREHRGAVEVIFDRRVGERRRGRPYSGEDTRRQDSRRRLTPAEHAQWAELRYLVVY